MSHRLRVNPIACKAHGMCAELLPERITLDEWGYPLIGGQPLEPSQVQNAIRAAQACPTFALILERDAGPPHLRSRAGAAASSAQSASMWAAARPAHSP
jgi:ferredoxin